MHEKLPVMAMRLLSRLLRHTEGAKGGWGLWFGGEGPLEAHSYTCQHVHPFTRVHLSAFFEIMPAVSMLYPCKPLASISQLNFHLIWLSVQQSH